MEIKTVKIEEIEVLASLAKTIWYESYGDGKMLSDDQIEYMVDKFQSKEALTEQLNNGYIYRGLYDGETLVGFAGSHLEEDNRTFLSKLYLLGKYHGQGYGKALFDDCVALYPNATAIYLTVNKTNPSYEIYKHLGLKVIDAVVSDIGSGYVMDDYIMQMNV